MLQASVPLQEGSLCPGVQGLWGRDCYLIRQWGEVPGRRTRAPGVPWVLSTFAHVPAGVGWAPGRREAAVPCGSPRARAPPPAARPLRSLRHSHALWPPPPGDRAARRRGWGRGPAAGAARCYAVAAGPAAEARRPHYAGNAV